MLSIYLSSRCRPSICFVIELTHVYNILFVSMMCIVGAVIVGVGD